MKCEEIEWVNFSTKNSCFSVFLRPFDPGIMILTFSEYEGEVCQRMLQIISESPRFESCDLLQAAQCKAGSDDAAKRIADAVGLTVERSCKYRGSRMPVSDNGSCI